MKPIKLLRNDIYRLIIFGFFLLISSNTNLYSERYIKLFVKNDTSKTFPVPPSGTSGYDRLKVYTQIYSYSLDGSTQLSNISFESWIKNYHDVSPSFVEFEVKHGEKCTLMEHKTYDEGTSKELRNYEAYFSEISVDWLNLDSNESISKGESVIGPCTLRFGLMPSIYRTKSTYSYPVGNAHYVHDDGFRLGFGSVIYVPSEAFINLKIEGTATDTSVGSTVGGGTSTSASGKNYVTVIPENSPKNVRIVLEQSTDLINWSAANQGVFSPSTTRRFFRVRSEEE